MAEATRPSVPVRPLVWDSDLDTAETPFGAYSVSKDVDDRWEWTFHRYPYGSPDETTHATKTAAMIAAGEDFQRRVRSVVLDEAPGPIVAMLSKALVAIKPFAGCPEAKSRNPDMPIDDDWPAKRDSANEAVLVHGDYRKAREVYEEGEDLLVETVVRSAETSS